MPHLIRARRFGSDLGYAVSSDGAMIADIKESSAAAVERAGLKGVSPHTLKYTCISWLMQAGHDPWRVSEFAATSMDTILTRYAHHHPDHQSEIADSFGRRPQNVRVIR
jgi:integrase